MVVRVWRVRLDPCAFGGRHPQLPLVEHVGASAAAVERDAAARRFVEAARDIAPDVTIALLDPGGHLVLPAADDSERATPALG